MASTSETGHGKNLAIFQELIIILKGYPDYQPSNPAIQIPQLESLRDTAIAAAQTLTTKTAQHKHAVNKRQEIFANLKTLSTRIINILDSSVASDDIVKDAKVFHRKIHGMRASSPKPQSPNLPPQKTISTAQLSYDSRTDHFSQLISLLNVVPAYNPNEALLQIANLQIKHEQMRQKTKEVQQAEAALSIARIHRNTIFYHPQTGMTHIISEAKKYIIGLYGHGSQQHQIIRRFQIRKQHKLTFY